MMGDEEPKNLADRNDEAVRMLLEGYNLGYRHGLEDGKIKTRQEFFRHAVSEHLK